MKLDCQWITTYVPAEPAISISLSYIYIYINVFFSFVIIFVLADIQYSQVSQKNTWIHVKVLVWLLVQ